MSITLDIGKSIRIERIFNRKSKRTIIIPMDHGLTMGTIKGLENLADMVDKVALGGANAVLMHSGMVGAGHRKHGKDIGLIIYGDKGFYTKKQAKIREIEYPLETLMALLFYRQKYKFRKFKNQYIGI